MPFDYINKLVAERNLPIFSKLLSSGSSGVLQSTIPPLSVPAWPSIYTGLNPGNHGIYGFVTQKKGGSPVLHNSSSFKGKAIWDILGTVGKKSIVVNVPLTNPPYPINGILVSGFPSSSNKLVAYPKIVERQLSKKYPHYKIDNEPPSRDYREIDKDEFIASTRKSIIERTNLVIDLMQSKPWDFFYFVYTESDRFQHVFWPFVEEKNNTLEDYESLKDVIPEFYKLIDSCLEILLEKVPEDTVILLVSDHGFETIRKYFAVSNWLAEQGIIEKKSSTTNRYAILKGIYNWFTKHLDIDIMKIYPFLPSSLKKLIMAPLVQAGTGGIHLDFEGGVTNKLTEEIIEQLMSIKDDGARVINSVNKKEDIYWGEYLDDTFDLILLPNSGYLVTDWIEEGVIKDLPWLYGNHQSEYARGGSFIAVGPRVKKGFEVNPGCYDIVPTILHTLGVETENKFDGRVLEEIFEPSVF